MKPAVKNNAPSPGAAGFTRRASSTVVELAPEINAPCSVNWFCAALLRENGRAALPQLLTAMSYAEIFSAATTVYDHYVEVLEAGTVEALRAYVMDLSKRTIPRGVETVIVGIPPKVAFAMVQLRLTLEGVGTGSNLEKGLAYLSRQAKKESATWLVERVLRSFPRRILSKRARKVAR